MSKLNGQPRWTGTHRDWTEEDVARLRGSLPIEYSLARHGSERLWELLHTDAYLPTLGAITGQQAVQMVKAGAKGIYVSGWQVAGDNNLAGETYPDQSLYPAHSAAAMVRRLNKARQRADQIEVQEGKVTRDWFVPIVADAEAGF